MSELKFVLYLDGMVGGLLDVFIRVILANLCDWYIPQPVDHAFSTLHYHFSVVPYLDAGPSFTEYDLTFIVAQAHN